MPKIRFAIALGFLVVALTGCNSHAYWAEAMQYHTAARDVLIKNGICASEQDCQTKSLLFAEGGEVSLGFVRGGGVYINLYETQDPALVEAVETKFIALHSRLGEPDVTLTVYSSKHLEPKVKFREVEIK